jgi:hypothetical protein
MNTLQIISEALSENKLQIESLNRKITTSQNFITNQFINLTTSLLDRVNAFDKVGDTGQTGIVQLFSGDCSSNSYTVGVAAAGQHHHDSVYLKSVPTASTSTAGVVKVGNFLSATTTGVLTVKTGTTSTTVAAGNHTHSTYLTKTEAKTLYGMPIKKFNASSIALSANTFCQMTGTTAPSSLSITFISPSDTSVVNEYFLEFFCTQNSMTLSYPTGVKWSNGEPPVLISGSTYQISFTMGNDNKYLAISTEFK